MIQYEYIYIYVRTPPHKQSIKPFSFKGDDLGTTKIGSPCDSRFHGHRAKHFARDLDLSRPFNMTSFCAPSHTPHTCHLPILHAPWTTTTATTTRYQPFVFNGPSIFLTVIKQNGLHFIKSPLPSMDLLWWIFSIINISILRIASKKVARIRAVMLVAKTHHDCCGGLDDINKTLAVMDAITAGLAGRGPIATSHLPKQRGIQSPLKMLRQYSSTVHGCNLVLHAREECFPQRVSKNPTTTQELLSPRLCCHGWPKRPPWAARRWDQLGWVA